MELYPSIPTIIQKTPIYAFDKLDGSNIRVEWSRKTGFYKYGTRTRLLDPNEPVLGEAVTLFENKYAEQLDAIYRKQRYEKTTSFMEFYGKNSFAGQHVTEPHTVTLFDVHVYKKGILPPKEFLKLLEDKVPTVPLLYQGNPTENFVEQVRTRTLEGVTFEGVVCKGGLDKKRRVVTFKIKTFDWLDAVKEKYGHNPALLKKII